ncbi:MAG TPA: hypothetical protein VFG71_00015 [Nitrospiraceae bacterium]|nr:hypothetical protein [Nitrospiraceae bacterium]
MNARPLYPHVLAVAIGFAGGIEAAGVESDHVCGLASAHAGVTFPVERVERAWACRLQPIVSNYTTANKIGPIRTSLPEEVYDYLLDHPPMAAHLVNRLDIGLYKAEARALNVFWGTDGEGTEGVVRLVYRDQRTRIYYLEGRHDGTFLPPVTGKAVALFRIQPVPQPKGNEAVDTTVVAYLKLDNRVLSGVMSLLRPLIGNVISRQFMKAFHAADRLSELMRQDPDRVLFEAADAPSLPADEVAFLSRALSNLRFTAPITETKQPLP